MKRAIEEELIANQEDAVSADVLATRVTAANITSPARSIEVDERKVNRG